MEEMTSLTPVRELRAVHAGCDLMTKTNSGCKKEDKAHTHLLVAMFFSKFFILLIFSQNVTVFIFVALICHWHEIRAETERVMLQ